MKDITHNKNTVGFLRAAFNPKNKFKYSGIDNFMYQGSELAHYTNLHGLKGIIESNGFWLSDHRLLNDAEEYSNGKLLALELLKTLLSKQRYFDFKEVIQKSIELLQTQNEEVYYICSFSTNKDSLNQWKGYAKSDDSVSIVFDNNSKDKMFGHFCMLPFFTASKVIYSNLTKYKILLDVIRNFHNEFKKDLKNNLEIDHEAWAYQLYLTLSFNFINFKHKEFESESEVRLSIHHSQLKFFKLHHRIANNKIIPFVNLADVYNKHLKDKKLPIKEIIVGPISNQETTYQSIKIYLRNLGYNNIVVTRSKVPYRG